MLSYDAGVTTPPLLEQTIGDNLAATVASFPDREALVECATGRRWTYAAFFEATRRIASALIERGTKRGDRIGIWAPNCAEWTMIQYASAQVGAILVNINPAYRSDELEYVLNQSSMCTVFAAQEFKSSDYVSMLENVRGRCPALSDVIVIGWEPWQQIADTAVDADVLARVQDGLRPVDPINIQYTSGTTGFPKGATLTHTNILNNGYLAGEGLDYTENDRVCIPVPFYHCFGMVLGNLACTTHGAAMVIPAPGFEPEATLKAVAAEQCTSLYGVPTMFIAELELPNFDSFDLSSLRTGIMAGSTCPEQVMRNVMDRMHMSEVTIMYGMTETSPMSIQTRPTDSLTRRVTTVGRVVPHTEIQVVDLETGAQVERGMPGELCTRGYCVMAGYWKDPEKTAEAVDGDGWMHTGDIGVMDADGYLAITGRIKDMVIRGGENIYPREIEEFLYGHPDIVDAQVVGVPDEKYGEELMAWVRLREGAEPPTPESLRAFCADRMAHNKIPRYVQVIDDYPMTVTGKVRKVELRERGEALLGDS
ncbi:AMP-binding protein [Mycobacterium sp. ITM-2016-00318]|uniref:AMP-binding protein n=1 Tax=Mycobacterium sp. ITM-2016-00318 TaxID=2099693 RepID=UPI000CFA3BF8|nr:AMP-binding protein [Mycobacterium sp. ITM-2016-00318]WNG92783.1 AMP-binding protein [Mycobacterium sp. ITM-2016-00318]